MNNLYIVGNGFDLAHGLPTSYTHFAYFIYKNYIADTQPEYKCLVYEEFLEKSENILISLSHNVWNFPAEEIEDIQPWAYVKGVLAGFLGILSYCETDDLWSHLEYALGEIDYQLIRDEIEDIVDKEGDLDPRKTRYVLEDGSSPWPRAAQEFKKVFRQWIATVDIEKSRMKESFLNYSKINKGGFINFNYTETLQKMYDVQSQNILYIHGFRGNEKDELIVGHCAREVGYKSYMLEYDDNVRDLHEELKKDVQLGKLKKFLDIQENVDSIICIGFSFGDSDDEYIRALINHPKTSHAAWLLNEYCKNEVAEQFKKLQRFGVDPSKITSGKIL